MLTEAQSLRPLLDADEISILPGATDPWTARLIERVGFRGVYMTGAGLANAMLGVPDIGLTTLTEMATQAGRIAQSVDVPVLADADTGFGGVANVARTVREYERAGVAALHLEDQVSPKRCGHFDGTTVVPVEEMLLRLHAALEARTDPNFAVIARTDARASEGLDAAIERGRAYAAAGIDGLFVEALKTVDEFAAVGAAFPDLPLIANMVEGGKSPLIPAAELQQLGFRLVIYANLPLRLSAAAVLSGLEHLRAHGSSAELLDRVLPWAERQAIVGIDDYHAVEARLLALVDETLARVRPPASE